MAILLTRLCFGRVADRKGEAPFVYLGNLSMFASLMILASQKSLISLILAGVLAGFGFGGIEPALQSMAIRKVVSQRRGAANSTFLCAYDIGIGAGGGVAGILIAKSGYGMMYVLIALANLISIGIYFLWAGKQSSAFRTIQSMEESRY